MPMKTKSDLSFQEAKLDYAALIRTAQIATVEVQGRLEDLNKRLHQAISDNNTSQLKLIPEWMEQEVARLTTSSETLAALVGGLSRAHITIINRTLSKEAQEYLDSEVN